MKKIVVLGGGFGGLHTAIALSKKLKRLGLLKKYEALLIDRNDHHTYTPLLYEVATTSKNTANLHDLHEVAAYTLKTVLHGYPVTFIQGEITSVDLINGIIYVGEKKITAHYIVLALGSEPNYFAIPGLKEHSLAFKTFKDAVRVRDAIWNLMLEGRKDIGVVIGGGGPTGVELAGELKAWCGELEQEFKKCRLNVTIVQAKPTILNEFHRTMIRKATQRLRKLGVTILTNKKVAELKEKEAVLANGQIMPFDLFVWAGGVKAPDMLARLPLKEEERDQVTVLGEMECLPQNPNLKLHSRIYGIGDNVCFYDPVTKKQILGVARAAISQGTVAAHNIIEDIKVEEGFSKSARHRIYRPMEYPYIIPIGGKYAVAKIGPFVVSGFLGWLLKGLVELNYLVSIMPFMQALKIWLKGLKIFIRNDRLG